MKTLIATVFSLMLLIPGINTVKVEDTITITVTVEGIRNSSGSIAIALHNEESDSDFPEAEAFREESVSLNSSGDVEIVFEDIPAGDYAVALMHDENDNGDLDFNEFGMPIEGFGFSNEAMGDQGPPDFDQAAFSAEKDTDITVSLIYMGS
ncbi:MAG: DUF2141 domain-containing protein [Roseivirga sp.]|nr:DUF2141 domain-containing protein [Roseivirga sp.]